MLNKDSAETNETYMHAVRVMKCMPHPIMHSSTHCSLNIIAHSIRSKFFNIHFVQNNSFFLLFVGNLYIYKFHSTYLCPKIVFFFINIENNFGLGGKIWNVPYLNRLNSHSISHFKWFLFSWLHFDKIPCDYRHYRFCLVFSIKNRKIKTNSNSNNRMKYITSTFKYIFSSVCPRICAHLIYHK